METTRNNEHPAAGDTGTGTPRSECARGRHGHGKRRIVGGLVIIALAAVAGFAGGLAGKSFASGGPGAFMGGSADPAKAQRHIERMIGHVAAEVDATPEQRQKLDAIAKAAASDLLALRGSVVQARARGIDLLAAPVVDRAAVEALRAQHIALADAASKRLAQALADAADVLTVEQRKLLAERAHRFGDHHGRAHG